MQTASSAFLTQDGFMLSYRTYGIGIPTLVLGSSTYYPQTFSSELFKHLQCTFSDHRGFAPCTTEATASSFSLAYLLADIRAIQGKLDDTKCILVGHSIHAWMALEYAKNTPIS